ncbi:amino acid ABC transporter substrate-binding protein [Bifidobacterium lemurum]|uniref:Amino acid ABC transporter substrate-binding protein n=1 Tax=Bifidobacterium lemurum TaxID=1603886 RepID=A0A261FS01_9BIFI|nr:transporter substrate-binding domain-containing protein [Bifidobacterium lemurum]OZG61961.1 amino acid ABC transporter substrate-binding protein [Bifidobacterium lemurum]QOL35261.1 transporter substrate-binding domain-containing protein [Bifidobacterium lemurum]
MHGSGKTIRRPRRWALAVVALLACSALMLLGGCTSGIAGDKGTLKVGVRADIIGFGYLNEKTGKYYGLEIDIATEMASRMGYGDVEFVTVTPDDRKEMLSEGKVDALVACYSIADSRKKNFDFSPAYYNNAVVMVVQNSSLIDQLSGLKGGTIGTMAGANTAPMLAQKMADEGFSDGEVRSANEDNTDVQFDNYHLLQYASYQELSDALEEGLVDGMALDGAIAKTYMNDERHTLDDFSIDPQEYGVATQKDSDLSEPVATTIQSMLDDGTIDQLIDKWD